MQDNVASQETFWERQERVYKSAYVSIFLLVANTIVFFASTMADGFWFNRGAMVTELVLGRGQIYRLFTAMFLHADLQHLMNNMLMLLLVGAVVEYYTGPAFYIFLYILSGLFGNLISMAYELRNGLSWVSVGASGAIMGLVGFVVVWILVNRKSFIRSRNMLFRLLLLGAFVIQACFFQEGANTAAHLGGFVTGFVFGCINIIVLRNNKLMEGLA
jgi:rhomboid protease GluP